MSPDPVSASLQIWTHTFCRDFDRFPPHIQQTIQDKIDEMGARLESFPHHRLRGANEYRLRVGDHRMLHDFDAPDGKIYLLYVGHRREVYK
ncbi:MAG: type II toxin-antitoxin system RelE/ParE family toxin [Verrucomicrobiae bacterium]|nr:type II toxin-antitoxin system RelE/ParE family toxin [Verrucomicrobiae bacterium]